MSFTATWDLSAVSDTIVVDVRRDDALVYRFGGEGIGARQIVKLLIEADLGHVTHKIPYEISKLSSAKTLVNTFGSDVRIYMYRHKVK